MKRRFTPSPLYELLGRRAPGTPIDWDTIDWDARRAAVAASKIITFCCGHTGPMPTHITQAAAPAYSAWMTANRDCLRCYNDAQASAAAILGQSLGLPALIGSYKQVCWASTIRRRRMEEVEAYKAMEPLAARTEQALDERLTVVDAAWWINTRAISLTHFAVTKQPSRKARP